MPRGGRRQGTPGKAYANRTDLALDPNMQQNTAATGGMTAPAPTQGPAVVAGPLVGADAVPNLSDPTMRPNEPVTAGTPYGAGPGTEALPPMPPRPVDPVRQRLQALLLVSPNADLARALDRLNIEGR